MKLFNSECQKLSKAIKAKFTNSQKFKKKIYLFLELNRTSKIESLFKIKLKKKRNSFT